MVFYSLSCRSSPLASRAPRMHWLTRLTRYATKPTVSRRETPMRNPQSHQDLAKATLPTARTERVVGGVAPNRVRGMLSQLWRARWPLLFVSPFFILFAVFGVYPIIFSLWLSFHSWKGVGDMQFVRFDNFALLFRDNLFWNSMLNSLILFFIYVPLMTFLAVVLASILNAGFLKLQGVWRALIFVPYITSMVASG